MSNFQKKWWMKTIAGLDANLWPIYPQANIKQTSYLSNYHADLDFYSPTTNLCRTISCSALQIICICENDFVVLRYFNCSQDYYSRTSLERPSHWPWKYGLSRYVDSRDRFNCTGKKMPPGICGLFKIGGLSQQWSFNFKTGFTVHSIFSMGTCTHGEFQKLYFGNSFLYCWTQCQRKHVGYWYFPGETLFSEEAYARVPKTSILPSV